MPDQVKEFQRVNRDSGNVTGDSAIVTDHSGQQTPIGHDETESAVTFARNRRSRSIGMTGHDGPEYASTLFISCSDSRLVPELVTQHEPGGLFVIRNAGNIVLSYGPEPGGVSASIEYAVSALQVTDVVICGHSDCGAMTAIATCQCMDHMPAVGSWLRYADSARIVNDSRHHETERERVEAMVRENVIAQLENIRTHPSVRLALRENRLTLHGWVYDIESGRMDALDGTTNSFVSLAEHTHVRATPAQLSVAE